jgi:hypothetical protein
VVGGGFEWRKVLDQAAHSQATAFCKGDRVQGLAGDCRRRCNTVLTPL